VPEEGTAGMPRIAGAEKRADALLLRWDNGRESRFPWFWLRDHGQDPASLDPKTLQRRVDTFTLDESLHGSAASVLDEGRALAVAWPDGGEDSRYSADFLATFAEAQVTRNRRITAWVKERLGAIRASDTPYRELGFVVHGTMADPRWLDPTIEPSDRVPGTCYLGDPRVVNDGPVGLARFSSLRSWLSQWSIDDARCDAIASGAALSVPVLVIGNTADDACTPSHTARLFDAVGHDRKQLHMVQGATHYYTGPDGRAHLAEAVEVIGGFLSAQL